jgi:phage-related protein
VGKSLKHMGTGEIFLNRTPIAYTLRSRVDKWDLIKLKSFYKAKDTVNRTKWQPTDWEKIFVSLLIVCRVCSCNKDTEILG